MPREMAGQLEAVFTHEYGNEHIPVVCNMEVGAVLVLEEQKADEMDNHLCKIAMAPTRTDTIIRFVKWWQSSRSRTWFIEQRNE